MMNNMHSREQECLLRQLMAYDFVQLELNLFLDTHPNHQRALKEFHSIKRKADELREIYEGKFGALTASSVKSEEEWTWIKSPWPWEN